jgi:hypothetical protein
MLKNIKDILLFIRIILLVLLDWFVTSSFVYWVIYCFIFCFWFFGAYGLAFLMDASWYYLTGYHFYTWFFGFACVFYWFVLIDLVRVYLKYVRKEPDYMDYVGRKKHKK